MAPKITLLEIDAEPNNCPLGDPLELKVRRRVLPLSVLCAYLVQGPSMTSCRDSRRAIC